MSKTIQSFTWGELKSWATRKGFRISSDPLNPPSCQLAECHMNEQKGGHFQDHHEIRLWKVEHSVPVKMIDGRVFKQARVDILVYCASHEINLPVNCRVTPICGTAEELFQLAAQVLRFSLLERAISQASFARYPLKRNMRRERPADSARRAKRNAIRS